MSNWKERRKALGWSRAEVAERAGVNSAALALVERGIWDEVEITERLETVYEAAEAGDFSVRLPPPQVEGGPDGVVGQAPGPEHGGSES